MEKLGLGKDRGTQYKTRKSIYIGFYCNDVGVSG
jgi:hypothetical protein